MKMKLLNVKIEGFRNIESDSIEFGNGITSLVSTNSYGKSNLMRAIDFAVDFIAIHPRLRAIRGYEKRVDGLLGARDRAIDIAFPFHLRDISI